MPHFTDQVLLLGKKFGIILLLQKEKTFLNGFKNIVENGAFAHYEQMLHFPQCFQ